ncbi:MAG: heparinase [Candidatus Hydrogenedens sp.]|nr:heparinase [Candidatus Hydrogenedens sp.]
MLRLARQLPLGVVLRRAAAMVGRRLAAAGRRAADLACGSFPASPAPGPLGRLIGELPVAAVTANRGWILPLARLALDHRFDLLGSGWVEVVHGMACTGVEGHRYPAAPAVAADPEGVWLKGRINRANLAESRRLWRLVDPGYRPLDWQLDIKSGWRWREDAWSQTVAIGARPGVDIKLPWELARMQHLAVLAWAYRLAVAGDPEAPPADRLVREFRNQVLDFVATNPPRFGVNWRCTMDVAIRAANWVIAYDLFRAAGAVFDDAFEGAFSRALLAHGGHIVANLEWYPDGRANHYFADIAGLLVVAAWLPASPESDAWLAFAAQELVGETAHQFGADGANFEASTCYHRLSAEMAAFGTAVLLGLPAERAAALRGYEARRLRRPLLTPGPPLKPGPIDQPVPPAQLGRLAGMGWFTLRLTKPSGRIAQIGDNDSGRFLKLHPIVQPLSAAAAKARYANLDGWPGLAGEAVYWDEAFLDHRPLLAALAVLTGEAAFAEAAGGPWLDAVLVRALLGGRQPAPLSSVPPLSSAPLLAAAVADHAEGAAGARVGEGTLTTTEIVAPGGDLRHRLARHAWPDFGLWLWRSDRLFLAIRCGSIGHGGRGAHAHNDQLAIELAIDGEDWITDPGSYLYTALPHRRDAFRSVAAHAAPRFGDAEPGRLDLGPFWLGNQARARVLAFDDDGFAGEHQGYGRMVRRRVTIAADRLVIVDSGLPADAGPAFRRLEGGGETRAAFAAAVGVSPGYGKLLRAGLQTRE